MEIKRNPRLDFLCILCMFPVVTLYFFGHSGLVGGEPESAITYKWLVDNF